MLSDPSPIAAEKLAGAKGISDQSARTACFASVFPGQTLAIIWAFQSIAITLPGKAANAGVTPSNRRGPSIPAKSPSTIAAVCGPGESGGRKRA